MPKPHFTIKNRFQKRSERYEEILTEDLLRDICQQLAGRQDYTVTFIDEINVGRLATLEYNGTISYISFSENKPDGRNSSMQSFPSAFVSYYNEANPAKNIYFYFLPTEGKIETPYFIFMYRLMKTLGVIFLNENQSVGDLSPFNSVLDIIAQRNFNKLKNKGNASTYLTLDENNTVQIFGKTYGANKYETTLLCIAIHKISANPIEMYEIKEGGLTKLPSAARKIIISLGVSVFPSNIVIERDQAEFNKTDGLRSPTYIYNLLEKLGEKKCFLCACDIPQLIQGAHIWPVAGIKRIQRINLPDKIQHAISGDNGLWLCNNHHKLFDINFLYLASDGRVKYKADIDGNHKVYLINCTTNNRIPEEILTSAFIEYLDHRNRMSGLNESDYNFIGT